MLRCLGAGSGRAGCAARLQRAQARGASRLRRRRLRRLRALRLRLRRHCAARSRRPLGRLPERRGALLRGWALLRGRARQLRA
jgi:hypothetical protein